MRSSQTTLDSRGQKPSEHKSGRVTSAAAGTLYDLCVALDLFLLRQSRKALRMELDVFELCVSCHIFFNARTQIASDIASQSPRSPSAIRASSAVAPSPQTEAAGGQGSQCGKIRLSMFYSHRAALPRGWDGEGRRQDKVVRGRHQHQRINPQGLSVRPRRLI